MKEASKGYPTIGCCGIDCGLCPRYHSRSASACPGCGGTAFREKHPSCGVLTCCLIKHGHEVCALCTEYPCSRYGKETTDRDSFVTHKKIVQNHSLIRENGFDSFLRQQSIRITILEELLSGFDDGRSMSFFCLSTALLPVECLQEVYGTLEELRASHSLKERCRLVREKLQVAADDRGFVLKLGREV